MASKLSSPPLQNSWTPSPSQDHVKDHEHRLEQELKQLQLDIVRIGDPQEPYCLFGELFEDEEAQQYYEALVGTLKSAKKRKLINFKGQMLLKGMHDDVRISLVQEQQQVPSLTQSQSLSSESELPVPPPVVPSPKPTPPPPRHMKKDLSSDENDTTPVPSSYNMEDVNAALPPALPSLEQQAQQKQGASLKVSKRTPPRWTKRTTPTKPIQSTTSTPESSPIPSPPVVTTQRASTPPPPLGTEKKPPLGTPPRKPLRTAQLPVAHHQTPPRPPTRTSVSSLGFKTPPRPPSTSSVIPKAQSPNSSVEGSPGRLKIPTAFLSSDDSDGECNSAASPRRRAGRLYPCGAWSDSEMVVTRKQRQEEENNNSSLVKATSEHRRIKSNVSERWTKLFQEHSPTRKNKKEIMEKPTRRLRKQSSSSGSCEKKTKSGSSSPRKSRDKSRVLSPAAQNGNARKAKKEAIRINIDSSPGGKSKAATAPVQSQPDVSMTIKSTPSQKSYRRETESQPKEQGGGRTDQAVAPKPRPKPKFRASMMEGRVGKLDSSDAPLSRTKSDKALIHSNKNSFVRVDEEVQQLLKDIARLSIADDKGPPCVPFGVLFTDEVVQNTYEALVGTLRSAKKKGLIKYDGQLLLKGVHDNVMIEVV